MSILETRNVVKRFGGLVAVNGLNIRVEKGEIVGLIGPNGSGKTTFFNCISGIYKPDEGEINLNGKNIAGLTPHEISNKGISRTFQIVRSFSELTVLENVMVGKSHNKERIIPTVFTSNSKETEEQALGLLRFTNLLEHKDRFGKELSYGQQKLLELGRALMSKPQLILLDEPVAGVNLTLVNEIKDRILELKRQGTTFLVVEHNLKVVRDLCDRVYVLSHGKEISHGTPSIIEHDKKVIEAYLGEHA